MAQRKGIHPPRQETWVQPLGQEDPLKKEMATHSSVLAGKSHGQRNLAGYSPWGHKESDVIEATEPAHTVSKSSFAFMISLLLAFACLLVRQV